MRSLIVLGHVSLDGFMATPDGGMGWLKLDDEVFAHVDSFIAGVDTGLYGPKTFDMMEAHWPAALSDPQSVGHQLAHARWYAKAQKVVFSRTLEKLSGGDATHARLARDPAAELRALKAAPGKNLMIFGSARLVQSCLQLGLVDELVLNINPVLLGAGIPLFASPEHAVGLHLLGSTRFKNGVLGCHYKVRRD